MKPEETSEILLLALRLYRSQAQLVGELSATVQALEEMISLSEPTFFQKMQDRKTALMSEAARKKSPALEKLDDIIRQLERERPPLVN